MKKGLFIGIDNYKNNQLVNCVNDATTLSKLFQYNDDGTVNFETKELLNEAATRSNIRKSIKELFEGDSEMVLLYFSGHGLDDDRDGVIVSVDYSEDDCGVRMEEILSIANKSKCKNKIIILDCCKGGLFGKIQGVVGDNSALSNGLTILTATTESGLASDGTLLDGHGLFTALMIEALKGGAYDILGRVTPGSVYAYIDQALGAWEQRPVFKTNVSEFSIIRQGHPKISLSTLQKITKYFGNPDKELFLNPSFEETNIEGGYHAEKKPYAIEENVKVLKDLQKLNRNGLLIPKDANHMYDVVMESKSCILTPLGKHYWNLVKKKKI